MHDDDEPLEDLLAECLSRLEREGGSGLEALCEEHPAHADALRGHVAFLRDAGLLEQSGDVEDFPEALGEFRLLERLGAGGMGVVYLAEQPSLGRRVAIKLIRPEQGYFPGARARFQREVEAVARLAHPGIVPVHAVGEERGIPYFAMEYVRGASLERVLRVVASARTKDGRTLLAAVAELVDGRPAPDTAARPPFDLPWAEACYWIAREVAQPLEHAHQRGVLHRDVKPSNVMLTADGRVVLLDFGLASTEGSATLTRTGSQPGSLAYMAPEQLEGDGAAVGPATDVYGLGVLLHELLSGERPFGATGETQLRAAILDGRATDLRASGASRDAQAVVAAARAVEPKRRYASAADFARDLTRLLEGRPVEARPPGAWTSLVRWTTRHRGAAAAVALTLVLVVGGPIVFGLQQLRTTRRIEAEQAVATRNLRRALQAVREMLVRVSDESLVAVPQLEQVRRELLAEARQTLDQLEVDAGAAPELRRLRADVVLSLAVLDSMLGNHGLVRQALEEELAALDAYVEAVPDADARGVRALLQTQLSIALVNSGAADEALALIDDAERAYEAHGDAEDPRWVRVWTEVGKVRSAALRALGRTGSAIEVAERAVERGERLVEVSGGTAESRRLLGVLLNEAGRVQILTDPEHSLEWLARARGVFAALREANPVDGFARMNLAEVDANRTQALSTLGRTEEALEVALAGEELARSNVRDYPTVARYRELLATHQLNAGVELMGLQRAADALELIAEACVEFETLALAEPENSHYAHAYAAATGQKGAALLELGRTDDAEEVLDEAIALHRAVVSLKPDSADYRRHYGIALMNRGINRLTVVDHVAADEDFAAALPMLSADPNAQAYLAVGWMTAVANAGLFEEVDDEEREALCERYRGRALEALTAAVDNGYRGREALATNPLWESLRERDAFQALLERLDR